MQVLSIFFNEEQEEEEESAVKMGLFASIDRGDCLEGEDGEEGRFEENILL